MGGTKGIAAAIGEELQRAGIDTTVTDADTVGTIDGYDAVVVGSAVYAARWRSEAVDLLARLAGAETPPRTWIFQSGPFESVTGTTDRSVPSRVHRLAVALGAPPVATFGGRIEPATAVGFIARRMAVGPSAGDYRDFDEIRRWAAGIAAELAVPLAPAG
jgi:menaquinone-dependent protoporphyrinogen oxidase